MHCHIRARQPYNSNWSSIRSKKGGILGSRPQEIVFGCMQLFPPQTVPVCDLSFPPCSTPCSTPCSHLCKQTSCLCDVTEHRKWLLPSNLGIQEYNQSTLLNGLYLWLACFTEIFTFFIFAEQTWWRSDHTPMTYQLHPRIQPCQLHLMLTL